MAAAALSSPAAAAPARRHAALPSFSGLRRSANAESLQLPFSTGRRGRGRAALTVRASGNAKLPAGRRLRVAVIGGGPAGGCAAETLAKGGVETVLIERKMDNCKPCGGAIPLCMVGEFDLPQDIIDRRVRKMKMISPSNVSVNIGRTLKPDEYIGMLRREVLDSYLRERAAKSGATLVNGLFLRMDKPAGPGEPYRVHYTKYDGRAVGEPATLEVDAVIGADGANSRVAKSIGAGNYEFAIAFQVPKEKQKDATFFSSPPIWGAEFVADLPVGGF